jgi:SAM-dependent methyltransferase
MQNYDFEFSKIYDEIFHDKAYHSDTNILKNAYKKYAQKEIDKIIDIGCGTGRYTVEFAKLGYKVTGVDPSQHMIQIAKENFGKIPNCEFIKGYASDVIDKFQLAISMFNVVNHIMSLHELIHFFESVRKLLVDDGLFIFDCFNGAAALIDPPRNKSIEKKVPNGGNMRVTTICETSLMESRVIMRNTIKYMGKVFLFNLEHRLWSPMMINELLKMANLRLLKLASAHDIDSEGTMDDYKIMFICTTA